MNKLIKYTLLFYSSLGLPCVFMIGGQTKTEEPEALFLRDGDVVIMSGQARMSYHAVPRVLPFNYQPTEHTQILSKLSTECSNGDTTKLNPSLDPADDDFRDKHGLGKRLRQNSTDLEFTNSKRSKSETEELNLTGLIDRVEESEFWSPFNNYMKTSRININVRQVFAPGKGPDDYKWPTEDPFKVS